MKPTFIFHSKPNNNLRRHTIVGVVQDDLLLIGVSAVSNKDTFKKKLGIEIATGRALKKPFKKIEKLNRGEKELKVLFFDITRNIQKLLPEAVIPQYEIVKRRLIAK